MSGEDRDDLVESLEDLDRYIAELQAERDEHARLLSDPQEQARRGLRRQQIAGCWAVNQMLEERGSLAEIREVSGEEDWLWSPEFLRADGWIQEGDCWRLVKKAD